MAIPYKTKEEGLFIKTPAKKLESGKIIGRVYEQAVLTRLFKSKKPSFLQRSVEKRKGRTLHGKLLIPAVFLSNFLSAAQNTRVVGNFSEKMKDLK